MIVDQPGFNINWLDFDYLGDSMHQEDNIVTNFKIYPNPTSNILNFNTNIIDYKIDTLIF